MESAEPTSIASALRHIYERSLQFESKLLDVNPKELAILRTVKTGGSINLKELAERTGMPLSTCGWIADKLAKSGMLSKKTDEKDHRAISLKLGAKGREMIERYEMIFDKISEIALGLLTAGERKIAVEIIEKISRQFP